MIQQSSTTGSTSDFQLWIVAVAALVANCRGADQTFNLNACPRYFFSPSKTTDIHPFQAESNLLEWPHQPRGASIHGRLQWIEFANGDRLTADILQLSDGHVTFNMPGAVRWHVPLSAVSRIRQRDGEREILAIRNREISSKREPIAVSLKSEDYTCRFCVSENLPYFWEAVFENGTVIRGEQHIQGRSELRFKVVESGKQYLGTTYQGRAPVNFRLHSINGQVYVSANETLLLALQSRGSRLLEISFASFAGTGFLESLTMTERADTPSLLVEQTVRDAIVSSTGEVWWGIVERADCEAVHWKHGTQSWRQQWLALHGLVFRNSTNPASSRNLFGQVVKLEFQPDSERPDLPPDRLTVVLRRALDGWLMAEHPLAGTCVIPLTSLRRIQRLHFGGVCHLPQNRTPRSTAQQIAGGVLEHGSNDGWLTEFVMEVSGLEPSGANTPPGSRSLGELRRGIGATELQLDGRQIGLLNEKVSRWNLPLEYQTVRLPLSLQGLQTGQHSWELRHLAGRRTQAEIQVRSIRLETSPPAGWDWLWR